MMEDERNTLAGFSFVMHGYKRELQTCFPAAFQGVGVINAFVVIL